ncbi:VanZ family protein [Bacillus sp. V59.32b]|uniref:VanZ family protein n=1 Tax=Bacillus sp. V59.32b TaxID=1758642 RepID=UPI000E3C9494|nr:VanZ family protein [Bacillus sp. V59.32b]RFU66886.1 VanZ family protein [Bacillus sp. V59.32b]
MIHSLKNNKLKMVLMASSYLLFSIYLLLLIYLLFFGFYRQSVTVQDYNLVPFKTIMMYISHSSQFNPGILFNNLAGNVLAFMPLGFFIPLLLNREFTVLKIIFLTFTVSLSVECVQYYYQIGGFDVDDIILNTIGGMAGFWVAKLIFHAKQRVFNPSK